MAHQEEASKVPVLVAPREQSVVRGDRVTFIWKPMRDARHYRVQVAAAASFEQVLYESEPLTRTEFTLRDTLPTDEDTYYWRVLVEDVDGTVHGKDNIESFLSATSEEANMFIAQPDQDETFGPAERLVRGAAAEAAAEVTHAPHWVQEEDELGVEHEGVEAGQILGMVLATAVALGLAVFTLIQYFDITAQAARIDATSRSGYPELREYRLHATQLLTQYEVVDPQAQRFRIPIGRAMELMANESRQQPSPNYSAELDLGDSSE